MLEVKVTLSADSALLSAINNLAAALGGQTPEPAPVREMKKSPAKAAAAKQEEAPVEEKTEESTSEAEVDVVTFNDTVKNFIAVNPTARKPILSNLFAKIEVTKLSAVPADKRAWFMEELKKVS